MNASERSARRLRRVFCRLSARVVPGETEGGGVRILMYHRVAEIPGDRLAVGPGEFARQMDLLVETGRPVRSLAEAFPPAGEEAGAIGPALVLTFDDGYRDFYDNVFPVLRARGLPAAVFVIPEFIEGRVEPERYRGRGELSLPLAWEMLAEMQAAGMTVGSHSLTHRELTGMSRREAEQEIAGSRRAIGRKLGADPEWFAYPRGKTSPVLAELVRRAGYRGAVTVRPGFNRPGCDRYQLRRTEIAASDEREDFLLKLRGGFDLQHRIWQLLAGERL